MSIMISYFIYGFPKTIILAYVGVNMHGKSRRLGLVLN